MGAQISRPFRRAGSLRPPPQPPPSAGPPARTHSIPNPISNPTSDTAINPSASAAIDLSAYEAACRSDPDLQNFDSNLQLRTNRAINSIAVGLDVHSLPLDSLRQVTECLLDLNQEVVKIILQNQLDILKSKELSDLVHDYFDNSLLTMDFCTSLDSCLKRAAHVESIIKVALRKFDEDRSAAGGGNAGDNYSRTLSELRNFTAAEEPFTQEFFKVFTSVYAKQVSMLERLQAKKRDLDKKLGKVKAWRKLSNVIFVATFATVLICSVVAAAVSAPPVVAALAAAAAVPLGSMGRWLNALWKKCERDLKGRREILSSMEIGTYIVLQDLANIRALVERFQVRMEALSANAGFATTAEEEEEEAATVVAVEEIREKVDEFMKTVRDLSDHANKCTQETSMARTLILRKIINHSTTSTQDIGGFGVEFEAVVVNLAHRRENLNLQEVQYALQAQEIRIQNQASIAYSSANIAYNHTSNRGQYNDSYNSNGYNSNGGRFSGLKGRGGGRAGSGGRFSYGGRDIRVICQLCGKLGHVAMKCFKRFDVHFTGVTSSPPQAFLTAAGAVDYNSEEAYYDQSYDNNWYVDSGATNHITHTMNNMQISTPYSGADQVSVGSGQQLPIQSIGQSDTQSVDEGCINKGPVSA